MCLCSFSFCYVKFITTEVNLVFLCISITLANFYFIHHCERKQGGSLCVYIYQGTGIHMCQTLSEEVSSES